MSPESNPVLLKPSGFDCVCDALVQFLLLQRALCVTPVPSVGVGEHCCFMQKASGVCNLKVAFLELL